MAKTTPDGELRVLTEDIPRVRAQLEPAIRAGVDAILSRHLRDRGHVRLNIGTVLMTAHSVLHELDAAKALTNLPLETKLIPVGGGPPIAAVDYALSMLTRAATNMVLTGLSCLEGLATSMTPETFEKLLGEIGAPLFESGPTNPTH